MFEAMKLVHGSLGEVAVGDFSWLDSMSVGPTTGSAQVNLIFGSRAQSAACLILSRGIPLAEPAKDAGSMWKKMLERTP